jgi:hypothetical protein
LDNYLLYKNIINFIFPLLLISDELILTRHSQFKFLSGFLAPITCFIVLLSIRVSHKLDLLIPVFIYSIFSFYYSILIGNDISDVTRFFIIIVFTLLAFYCNNSINCNKYPIIIPFIIQAIIIIAISFYLAWSNDPSLANDFRNYFIENGIGDVYTFNGYYFKVQIIGNALIPLIFYICLENYEKKSYMYSSFLMGLAIIVCGNLSYIVVSVIAIIIFFYKRIKNKNIIMIIILFFSCIYFYDLFLEKFISSAGSESSMDARFSQLNLIYSLLCNSAVNTLFGYGLGARLPGIYYSNPYIELQTMYIIYQIGLIGIIIYFLTLGILLNNFLLKKGKIIYLLYLASSIMNPYIFDSNQIIATLIIVLYYGKKNEFRVTA